MTPIGLDVLIARENIPEAELREALARVATVPVARVSVITNIANYPTKKDADLVCIVSSVDGQFPTLLSLDGHLPSVEDGMLVVERLSGALNAVCLMGTDDENPYAMWRVEAGHPTRRVFLLAEAANGGQYDIDHAQH